jgi:hypothetical protein
MKKIALLFFAVAAGSALMAQDSIWTVPALPHRGARVVIYFKSDKPAFARAKTLSGGFYSVDYKNRIAAQDLTYEKSGDNWKATASVSDTVYAVVANVVRPDTDAFAAVAAVGLDSSNGQPFSEELPVTCQCLFRSIHHAGHPVG